MTGRLANYFPERFTAFAFLAVGYIAPSPNFIKYEDVLAYVRLTTAPHHINVATAR